MWALFQEDVLEGSERQGYNFTEPNDHAGPNSSASGSFRRKVQPTKVGTSEPYQCSSMDIPSFESTNNFKVPSVPKSPCTTEKYHLMSPLPGSTCRLSPFLPPKVPISSFSPFTNICQTPTLGWHNLGGFQTPLLGQKVSELPLTPHLMNLCSSRWVIYWSNIRHWTGQRL